MRWQGSVNTSTYWEKKILINALINSSSIVHWYGCVIDALIIVKLTGSTKGT